MKKIIIFYLVICSIFTIAIASIAVNENDIVIPCDVIKENYLYKPLVIFSQGSCPSVELQIFYFGIKALGVFMVILSPLFIVPAVIFSLLKKKTWKIKYKLR